MDFRHSELIRCNFRDAKVAIKVEMLKCFTAVARHGSLSEAAEALGRTPSAVSMMLKQFEDHIGAPLFETARKSRLTPLGAMVLEEARRGLRQFENTTLVIEGLGRSEFGFLRLAVTPSIATAVLPRIMGRFIARFPEVQVDLRDMDSRAIADELARERADIGIGSIAAIEGTRRVELFSDPFGVICSKDHPLAQNWEALTWRDVAGHGLIANGLCDLITDPEFAPVLAASKMMVPSTVSLLGLVREGVGISVLPRLAVPDDQGDIVFLPLKDVTARRRVDVVSQPAQRLMPAARAFLDLVTEMKAAGAIAGAISGDLK